MQCPVYIIGILSCIFHIGAHQIVAIEQQPFELTTGTEQEYTIASVLTQSVILPCKAILLIMEPERVKYEKQIKNKHLDMMIVMIFLGNVV